MGKLRFDYNRLDDRRSGPEEDEGEKHGLLFFVGWMLFLLWVVGVFTGAFAEQPRSGGLVDPHEAWKPHCRPETGGVFRPEISQSKARKEPNRCEFGKPVGLWIFDGATGFYRGGVPDGSWSFRNANNGDAVDGSYVNGKRHGWWAVRESNGGCEVTKWANGKMMLRRVCQ